MNPFVLRVLLAADSSQQAAMVEEYLTEEGHEVVRVEARGEAALKAARLVHPNIVVVSGPMRGELDGVGLAAALQAGPADRIPVLLVSDPAELPGLLALQTTWPGPSDEAPSAPDASLEEASS